MSGDVGVVRDVEDAENAGDKTGAMCGGGGSVRREVGMLRVVRW